MTKHKMGLGLLLIIFIVAGCTGSGGIRARSYVEVKDRVDQKMEGNFGYLHGDPMPEDRSGIRKTRKTYVFEVTKEVEEPELEEVEIPQGQDAPSQQLTPQPVETPDWAKPIVLPSFEDDAASDGQAVTETMSVEYTVEKDDTLQKISKKFYDSYSEWPKIYEANKEVIGDPDKIKPGIVLRIPME